jgi:hypothetical protein
MRGRHVTRVRATRGFARAPLVIVMSEPEIVLTVTTTATAVVTMPEPTDKES